MTNAEARFSKSLRPRKPEGSLGRTAQDVHLDSHTAPELCDFTQLLNCDVSYRVRPGCLNTFIVRSVLRIVQELCESRGGRPELSVLTSLLVSVDAVKNY